jgi:hypothetical protein
VTVILCSTSGCGDPAVESGFGRCSFHAGRSNEVVFLGRRFSRRPVGYQKLAVFLMCWAFVGWVFADITPPSGSAPPPVKAPAGANGWPANSDPAKMCKASGGLEQALPTGDATPANPMPPGSQAACVNGAIESVVIP